MDAIRTRLLPMTGPLFTVLSFVVAFGLQGGAPGVDASGETVVEHYRDAETTSIVAALLTPLLATLLILFVAHLRAVARERRVSTGAGPTVMMSGAVLWATGMLLGSVMELALVDAADQRRTGTAETLNVLLNAGWLPYIAGIAITLVGAGITVLGSDFLPRWLGWVALVIGIVSLVGPGGFVGALVAPLWLLVAGALLARPSVPLRDPHREERRSEQPAARV